MRKSNVFNFFMADGHKHQSNWSNRRNRFTSVFGTLRKAILFGRQPRILCQCCKKHYYGDDKRDILIQWCTSCYSKCDHKTPCHLKHI